MLADPDITVVMAVRDGGRFIFDAIKSLSRQSVSPAEIILVDDGSTDDSARQAISAGEGLIRVIRQDPSGIAVARNRGIQAAGTEFIAIFDSDDLAPEGRFQSLRQPFFQDPDLQITAGRWLNFWDPSATAEADDPSVQHLKGEMSSMLLSVSLIRRQLFETIGPFCEDNDFIEGQLWLHAATDRGVKTSRVDDVVLHRRIHDRNFSRKKSADNMVDLLWLRMKGRQTSAVG